MKNQICTILGGGGFIGRYLVRNLTKKNYRCIISTRKPFQKGYLKTQATPGAVELINWDAKNFSELKEAIKNSDIVINLVGILYETRKQKFYNIHSGIPEAVSKICSESDVKKFIHVSAIGANESSKSLYQKSKHQGEVKALNNFKNTVNGEVNPEKNDGCDNYYYYLRFLTIHLTNGEQVLVGVATDYAKIYPDAPYIWLVNKNNEIEELGATKIEKYSLNFELSK